MTTSVILVVHVLNMKIQCGKLSTIHTYHNFDENNWFLLYSLCIFKDGSRKESRSEKPLHQKTHAPSLRDSFRAQLEGRCRVSEEVSIPRKSLSETYPSFAYANRSVKLNNHHRSEQLREIWNSLSSSAAVGLHINSIVFPTSGQSAITRETIPWPCIMLYQIPKVPRLPATAVLSLPPMLMQRSLLDVAGCVTNTRPLTSPEKFVPFACSAFRKQRQTPGAMAHHVMRNSPQSSGGLFF